MCWKNENQFINLIYIYSIPISIKYKEEYPWALPSSKGDLYAFCHICDVDISIKSVGAKGLRDHEATCRHSQKAHDMGLRPVANPSSNVAPLPSQQHSQNVFTPESQVHINSNTAMTTNMPASFGSDIPTVCTTTPPNVFSHPTHGREQHQQTQMGTVIGQSSLVSSQPLNRYWLYFKII